VHQAGEHAPADSRTGDTWVVDLDLEQCFARGHHDGWMSRVRRRVQARRVVRLIPRFLNAGVLPLEGRVVPTADGTPPGGPLAPLLANRLRDERDKELEPRGHRFARDADEANIAVRRRPAGERVMARVTRVVKRQLRLPGHEAKRAVDRPWHRTCLGVTCTRRQANRRQVRAQALKAFPAQGRAITGRTRGRTRPPSGQALRQWRLGGRAVCGGAEGRSPRRDLDQWLRRRRRDHWTPWGRRGSRERRTRGVGRPLAWNTGKSAHGPWRLRQSPALAIARPQRSCAALGLPSLRAD
jgi:hypothetical protein